MRTTLDLEPPSVGLGVERRADGVRLLVLERPERRNALDGHTIDVLLVELERIALDGSVRAVLIAGAGDASNVERVCTDPLEAALEMAASFARQPPGAVVATKRLVGEVAELDLPSAIDREAVVQTAALATPQFATHIRHWRAATGGDRQASR